MEETKQARFQMVDRSCRDSPGPNVGHYKEDRTVEAGDIISTDLGFRFWGAMMHSISSPDPFPAFPRHLTPDLQLFGRSYEFSFERRVT
jgi:hypothetical protein